VHLGCFIDLPEDWQYVDKVNEFCADSCMVGLNPKWAKLKSLGGLVTGEPLSLPYYKSEPMQRWVNTVLEQVKPDAVLIFSGVMAQFVSGKLPETGKSVLDLVDVDSDKWRLYAERHAWPMSWVYQRESQKLLAYEKAMAAEFDATLFVSEKEADYFKQLAPEVAEKVHWRVQGVDSAFFDPGLSFVSPYPEDARVLVFVGAMDYWPNIDAVVWFVESMFAAIKKQVPGAVFYIVGMNPAEQVSKLAQTDGVVVTGSVDDVRPYMKHAQVSVAPLRVARGIQNKVLEALSMGNPVIGTGNALNGIDFFDYQPVQADDETGFIEKCVEVLLREKVVDNTARDLILRHYNWDSSLARVAGLLENRPLL